MSTFEKTLTIINVLAIIIIPIIAVFIGQYLQNRSQRRKDKLEIFKTLMMNRMGWSAESARALNIIDIVFAEDKDVRAKWKDYYTLLCIQEPDVMQRKQIQMAQDKLLEAMAKALGYQKQVTWENIQNPYIPKGMIAAIEQQQVIQAGQEKWAGAVDLFTKAFSTTADKAEPHYEEDNPHANT